MISKLSDKKFNKFIFIDIFKNKIKFIIYLLNLKKLLFIY